MSVEVKRTDTSVEAKKADTSLGVDKGSREATFIVYQTQDLTDEQNLTDKN